MPHAPNGTGAGSRWLARDLLAGLVVFLVALPLCLGIAHASGAPLLSGLISGIVGGLVVGALSGSHVSVAGPAAGLAAIVLAQIESLGSFETFLLAGMLAGVMQVGLGLMRGGAVVNFVPNSVIRGLLAAIGILLILKQVPHLIGHDTDYEGDVSFAQPDGDNTFTALLTALSRLLPGAALVGMVSLGVMVAWEKTRLKRTKVPSALAAVLAGTLLAELLAAVGSSWAISASHMVTVPVLGHDGLALQDLLRFPDFSRVFDPQLLLAAVTLAVVASLETLLNLEATEKLDPLRRPASSNRELIAQGVGNTLAAAIGGLPMTSVIVRSSVNVDAGGRTRLSTIVHGGLLLVSLVLLAPIINRIPLASLAAVLVLTGIKLASPRLFVDKWRAGWRQFVPFAATVAAIVLTDLLVGVLIGLFISLSFVLARNLKGGLQVVRESHVSGLVHRIVLGEHVSYLARAHLADLLASFRAGDHVAIDARGSTYVDPDLLSVIRDFVHEEAPPRGIKVSVLGFHNRYELIDLVQYVDYTSREVQAALTPQRVLELLREGNRRFVSGERLNRDLARQVDATSAGQHPMAIVLSCIDSRAPAELLFDLGIGDIFSVRVAGNVAKQKAMGSIEFACKLVGSKLVVVLGHTRCGAVKATCDFVHRGLDPIAATGLTNLPSITEPIAEAVHKETATRDRRAGDNLEFVDRVTEIHVANTIESILDHSPTIAAMLAAGEIGIVGAMYDVGTGKVRFLPQCSRGVRLETEAAAASAS
ncbi:MAG: bifunctional SulP family inorganic anion transporter/carbonic anhydrase [Planctomycetes bacterium]|nr:bifunctional SulP family inorganic anion transporter/carbonic anhydrase [Planctomycetota bacterium]